jgi:hypothetical protein
VIANLDPGLVADALVNLFGAGGAVVVAHEVARSDPRGAVSKRIVFARGLGARISSSPMR